MLQPFARYWVELEIRVATDTQCMCSVPCAPVSNISDWSIERAIDQWSIRTVSWNGCSLAQSINLWPLERAIDWSTVPLINDTFEWSIGNYWNKLANRNSFTWLRTSMFICLCKILCYCLPGKIDVYYLSVKHPMALIIRSSKWWNLFKYSHTI